MSIFTSILTKLGFVKEEEETAPAPAPTPAETAPTRPVEAARKPASASSPSTASSSPSKTPSQALPDITKYAKWEKPMAMVDVMSKLEDMARGSGLNWRQSIVDLLKVLGIDSSYEARKELAKELGCPDEFMGDSAKMNTWLHKTVLRKIAENGGNIPQELLD